MTKEKKSGFVALVGRPNVGKSTLLNQILGTKVAITSNRPQTTRGTIRGIYTQEQGQIVFLDTPGMHKAKNKLGNYMVHAADQAVREVDLILWLVEPDEKPGPGDRHIAGQLSNAKVPVILVINKADTVQKSVLLPVIDVFRHMMEFDEIIPISALKGDGTKELLHLVFSYLPVGPYFYEEDELTDQPIRQMCAEIIREKALHALRDELPHGIAVVIESMKQREQKPITDISATIICEKASHKGMIIGKGGLMLKKIGSNARYEMERLIGQKIQLELWVKVKKDWRDSELQLKNFGYHEES